MKNFTPSHFASLLKKNWFQLGVIVILAIAFIQQDINVEFSIGDEKQDDRSALLSAKEKPQAQKASMGFALPSFVSSFNDVETAPKAQLVSNVKGKKKKGVSHQFIERFKEVAQDESQQFSIPASIIVGLGLHQANSPKATLAKQANNYFALPCTSSWEGASITHNDACYRSYNSAWFSFRDNSNFLNELRLKNGLEKKKLSVKAWTRLLERSGVITDGYAFLKLIRKYNLVQLDK